MQWLVIETGGFPQRTRIRLRLTEGNKDGSKTNGDVALFLRKRSDNTEVPLTFNNAEFVAHVKNGLWEMPDAMQDFSAIAQAGFDVLVGKMRDGRGTAVKFRSNQLGPLQTNPAPTPNPTPQPPKEPIPTNIKIMPVRCEQITISGKPIMRHQLVLVVVDQHNKGMNNIPLNWFTGDDGNCITTTECNGEKGLAPLIIDVTKKVNLKVMSFTHGLETTLELQGLPEPGPVVAAKVADRISAEVSEHPDAKDFFTAYVQTFCGNDPIASPYEVSFNDPVKLQHAGPAISELKNRFTAKDGSDEFKFKFTPKQTELHFRIPGTSPKGNCSVFVFDVTKL